MKSIRALIASGATALLLLTVGCASSGTHVVATAGDVTMLSEPSMRADRLIVKSSEVEGSLQEVDVIQVAFKNPDGTVRMVPDDKGGMRPLITTIIRDRVSDPAGKGLLQSVVPAIVTGGIQYKTAVRVAEENGKACAGGGCGGGTPIINQVYSSSEANSNSGAKVNVGATAPTCGAACSPQHVD
mgnify:CR=1 FL=1